MMMFSLAGIPPLAGFFAKFYVFTAAIQANLVTLAVIGVVTSVVGAYYYMRIVKVMYFDEPLERYEPMPAGVKFVLGLSSAFVVLFCFPAPLSARRAPPRARCSDVRLSSETNPPDTGSSVSKRRNRRTTTRSRAAGEGDPGALDRRGRTARRQRPPGPAWASPPGNLYASLLLIDPCDPALAPQLGFVAGLALHEAVDSLAGLARRACP